MADDLRDEIADAITYHPGNRTGTPEQRHPVSLTLADAVMREVVGPELERLRERLDHAEDRLRKATDEYGRLRASADGAEAARDRWRTRGEQAEATTERVRALLEGIERHCSDERLTVPPWVASVRTALATPTPTEETP